MKKTFYTLFLSILLTFCTFLNSYAQDTREVKNFHSVANAGAAEVFITMGDEEDLRIEGDDEDIERIETVVQNGILKIRTKRDINNWNVAIGSVKIYITAVKLGALLQSGSGIINLRGEMSSASADIQLSGSGKIIAKINAQSANVAMSGSGRVILVGKVGEINVTLAGSGDLNADKLLSENTKIKIAGNGAAYVNVKDNLDVKIVGPGAVNYFGDPKVSTKKLGEGTVNKM